MSNVTARRLFELVEPIAVVTYMAPEPTKAVMALGAGTDEYATRPRPKPRRWVTRDAAAVVRLVLGADPEDRCGGTR